MARQKYAVRPSDKLFADDQRDLFEKSYEERLQEEKNQPVECLGMTFENDEKRREYFLEKLREKLKDPEFRKIEGFPIGEDEDILALSDPPYYACPNPFIEDFIKHYGKPYDPKNDNYRREPFAADVSEGKNDPIYNAHSYHTKVPHKAIMRYILHYTEPGDVVLDGFCGTGMTVEFHNSKNSVWNSIQEALQTAGFVVADVRTLDKKHSTFKQITGPSAVKQDLIISAYKPNGGLEKRFKLTAGTEEGVWDFVRMHLKQLPVFVSKDGQAEVIAERQNYLLFDRMVAFHVQHGVTVPLSAAEFYKGLTLRFPERDGMYFLSEQAAEYDKKRMTVKEVLQFELFVTDESTAIQWLKQQLTEKPQTFQDIHPQFLKEIGGWQKHEKPLELSELLEQNFLRYDDKVEVPSQIHSYLSTNFKELRNLAKDDLALKAKGKDRWYVPDPKKAGDLEKLRDRALIREFEKYRESKQKRLKVFRLEAVRAGFKKAWQERDYATIIALARKIPEKILQEDPKLLMWYDQTVTRTGEE